MPQQANFGPHHPLWVELLEMKAGGFFLKDMVAFAKSRNHQLSVSELKKGFKKAPESMRLPQRGSLYLQRKFAKDKDTVSSMEMLKTFALEATDRYYRLLVEWQSALTPLHKQALNSDVVEAMQIAAAFWSRLVRLEKEAGLPMTGGGNALSVVLGGQNVVMLTAEDFKETVEKVVGLVQQRLQALTPELAALEQFGHDNVREVTDEDLGDEEDEL